MMTTFAAIGGGLPLALGQGAGSELRRPLGIAIVGGLLVSQWLTLYTTPVIYLYLDRFAHWLSGKRRRPTGEIPATVPAAASRRRTPARGRPTDGARHEPGRYEEEEYLEQDEDEREAAGRRKSLIALGGAGGPGGRRPDPGRPAAQRVGAAGLPDDPGDQLRRDRSVPTPWQLAL